MHAPRAPNPGDETEGLREAARRAASGGDPDRAVDILKEACDRGDLNGAARVDLAELAMGRRQYAVAASLLRSALVARPSDAGAWARLGNVLWRSQRYDESKAALDRANDLSPGNWLIEQNIGLWHYFTGDAESAVRYLESSLKKAPPSIPWVRNDLAHAVLKSGDLRRGMELFEVRWETLARSPAWSCGLPQWQGEPRSGEGILLHAEQGFGDTLQFFRFVELVRKKGKFSHVFLAGPLALKRLLEAQGVLDGYADHESVGDLLETSRGATCHAPLMSAFAALGLGYEDLPVPRPCVSWPAGSRRNLRPSGVKLSVGLVWSASIGHERSRQRSVSPVNLLPLGEVPRVKLWSLQMAPHAAMAIETGADLVISDATFETMDFADTAGIVGSLDAVVSVDTSMVHLCGALGKKVFMLNPVNACWRWARGAAPWYGDAVELFDQSKDLSWDAAISKIKSRLAEMISCQ